MRLKSTYRQIGVCLFFAIACLFPATAFGQRPKELHNGKLVAAGEVIVRLRSGAAADWAMIASEIDANDVQRGGRGTFLLHSRSQTVEKLLEKLAKHGEFTQIGPNYILQATRNPNDTYYGQLWGMRNTGQSILGTAGKSGADIGAANAWEVSTGNTAQVVAVIDTGVDYNHTDLAANIWSAPSAYTVNINGTPVTCPAGSHGFNLVANSCDPMDDNDHGTHVAGTIGATGNNASGVVGVNWQARIMAVKFLDASGSGTTFDAVNALEYLIQVKAAFGGAGGSADVRALNASWGGDGFDQFLLDAINDANSAGMLLLAAAGNSSSNNDLVPFYPANFDAPNLISVAAFNNLDQLAWFSDFGAVTVDLGAPGDTILSTKRLGGYVYFSGTSMATPHVTGAAMLVLSRCAVDTAGLRSILLSNTTADTALAGKTVTGGRLNVDKAIHSCAAYTAPTSLNFYSIVSGASSAALNVTLTNNQAVPLTISSITTTGDYSQTNNCPAVLASKAKCAIQTVFSPVTTGTRNGTLSVTNDSLGSPFSVSLTGIGLPAVTVSPASLSFGGQVVGTPSAARSVTLTNNQATPLSVVSITTTGDYSQTNTCGTSVAAKSSCVVSVVFTPTATGTRTGQLVISDTATGSPRLVSLTGSGLVSVTVAPTNMNFYTWPVGFPSTAKPVTLTNNLTTAVSITGIAITGDFSQTNNCGAVLAAKSACIISVVFTPTALNTRSGTLTISHSAPNSPLTVSLQGIGQAAVAASPSSLNFGNQVQGIASAARTVTLTNNQPVPLHIDSIATSGDYSQTNNCPAALSAKTNCAIQLIFTPTALGTRSGSLSVSHDSGSGTTNVPLSGTGVKPASLSATSLNFYTWKVGTTSTPKNVVLTNNQSSPLTILSISVTGDYAQTNNCPAVLPALGSCTITITFTPTATNTRIGVLTVADDSSVSPDTANMTGTGN